MRSSRPFVVPLILLGLMVAQALADDEGKPFAEARIVLQMADGDAESQTRVLNVANNLIKHYGGPDFVDIEIVATVESIERATGKRPDLIPEAIPVQTGVARLVERAQQGFVVIRP
jgi:intracellular sulfur oxidation DsrE/DsrF family protein